MADDKLLRKLREKLDKVLEANRNDEAVKLLAELMELEPKNVRWPHKRGDLLRKLGRDKDAIPCYVAAVDIYADQGFIARAVAMAKAVLNLDPTRIDILERVDPNAAQQLRQKENAELMDAVRRHPMVLDAGRAVAKVAAAAPAPAPPRAPPPPQPPPPQPHVSLELDTAFGKPSPDVVAVPAPPRGAPPKRVPRRRPMTLDQLSLPPPVDLKQLAAQPALGTPRTPDAAAIYSQALHGVPELEVDPSASPHETRFSNTPPRRGPSVQFTDEELQPREALSESEALRSEPPSARKLSNLPLFPLFAEVPKDALAEMIAGADLVELAHGQPVMRKGDPGDALYGIVEGSVHVIVPGQQLRLTLAEGDVFGESCLLQNERRHADVVVQGKLVALRIPRDVLTRLLARHPRLAEVLLELLTRRLLGNLLQSSPLFQEFDASGRRELAQFFEIRRAPAGTMLAVVGKRMDGLYISLTGTLSVNQPGAPERIAPPGSMFGQNTLLTNEPSQVDVKTRVHMVVLRLPSHAFTQVAMQYPSILARLSELSTSEVVKVTQ